MAASEEVLSTYATLSFGAIHVANDADSTVRGGHSVRVSVGAGCSGVTCPAATISPFFEITWELLPLLSAPSARSKSRSRLLFCVLGSEFNRTGSSAHVSRGSRRVLRPRSEVALTMKPDDGCLVANRVMSPHELVTYDDVNRPGILSVCDSHSPTESTIISGLVPSCSGCEKPLPNQDFGFNTVHLELAGFSNRISGQVFGQTLFLRDSQRYSTLPSYPAIYPSNQTCVVDLVPRILRERNSGALSSEPFDMFGLNFQSPKRVEEREALEIG